MDLAISPSTTRNPPTSAMPEICIDNDEQTLIALNGMYPQHTTPLELATTMRSAHEYLEWLTDRLPSQLEHNAKALRSLTAEMATAFSENETYVTAFPDLTAIYISFEAEYGFENPGEAEGPISEYLSTCGQNANRVFETIAHSMDRLDQVPESFGRQNSQLSKESSLPGNTASGYQYQDELTETSHGFCASLEQQLIALLNRVSNTTETLEDEEILPSQLAALFSAVDPFYVWLVDNLPGELAEDAYLLHSFSTGVAAELASLDSSTVSEDEFMLTMFTAITELMLDGETLAEAEFRISTFINQSCDQIDIDSLPPLVGWGNDDFIEESRNIEDAFEADSVEFNDCTLEPSQASGLIPANLHTIGEIIHHPDRTFFTKSLTAHGITLAGEEKIPNDFLFDVAQVAAEMMPPRVPNTLLQDAVINALYAYKTTIPVVYGEPNRFPDLDELGDASICDAIFYGVEGQVMEVVEHLLHHITDIGLHHALPAQWGLSRYSQLHDLEAKARSAGIYNENYDEIPEISVRARVSLQEFAYWLISSYWNLQIPFGPEEDGWKATTPDLIAQLLPEADELLGKSIAGILAPPTRGSLNGLLRHEGAAAP